MPPHLGHDHTAPSGSTAPSGTAATFSTDSSFSLVITESNAAQTVTGKINVIDPDAGQACLDLARTLGYSTASDYYKTGEATNTGSYYGSKTIFTLLSNNQLAVISDGDPYPAKAGAINFTNDLISTRFTSFIIEQDFEYKFTYRGGNLNSDASYSNFFSTSAMGIQGIFLNGVALYNPSSGNGTVPGTLISGNNTHNLNAVFFEQQYGIDAAGGHPSPEGNMVNGFQGQSHYHDPMFLTSGSWNNETFASSNAYFANDYYTHASGNIDYIRHADGHSKIVGFCFDGYPIYGPYGYDASFNPQSNARLMTTSYRTKATEFAGRPYTYDASLSGYTLSAGAFLDDYEYVPGMGSLDDCNGRFCVTPEYPNGTYAYFCLINEDDEPVFPYILGKYSRQQRKVINAGYPVDTHNTGGSVEPTNGTAGVFNVSTLGVSKYVSSPINQTVVDVSYGSFTIDSSGNWSYTMDGAHDEFVTDVSYNDSIRVYSYDGSANRLVTVTMMGTAEATLGPTPSAIRACLSCSQNSSSLHIVNVTGNTGTIVYTWLKDGEIVWTELDFNYINTVDCAGSTLVAQVGDENGYVTIATMTIGSDYKIALVIADTYVNIIPDQDNNKAFFNGFRTTDLTSVVIGNAVTSIGHHAFSGNLSLVDVTIGPSVGYIENWAFGGNCPGITAITIPDATTFIKPYAFNQLDANTHNINTFHIGAGLQNVNSVKNSNNYVTTLTISPSNPYLILDEQGVVYVKVDANNVAADFVLYDKTSVIIPATVTFNGVAIPVTSINLDALANVTSLTIDPANTTFALQDGIIYQKVDATNATITKVFGTVTNFNIPDTIVIGGGEGIPVTSIPDWLFSDRTSLTAVSIGNNVSYIGSGAFNNTRIESISIPASVTVIEFMAFSNNPSLISVTFAANSQLTTLRSALFDNTTISTINIPNSVVDIQDGVFNNCLLLTNVTIPYSVTSMRANTFSGCALLTDLSIDSANATYVEQDGVVYQKVDSTNAMVAFALSSLTSANMPSSVSIDNASIPVTSIGEGAFQGCSALTAVTIGASVTYIGPNAFSTATLKDVYFLGNNETTLYGDPAASHDFFGYQQFNNIASDAVAYYVATKTGWNVYNSSNPPAGFSDIQLFVPEGGSDSAPDHSSGSLTVADDAQIGNVSGGTVTVSSGTADILSTAGDFTMNLDAGNAVVTTLNGSGSASVSIGIGKSLRTFAGTFAGTLSCAGTLEKMGSGTLTLSGSSTTGFTGKVAIKAGKVEAQTTTSLGSAAVELGSSGSSTSSALKFNITSSTTSVIGNPIKALSSGSNILQNAGTSKLSFTGGLEKNGTPLTLDGNIDVNSDITGSSANSDLVLGDGSTSTADVTLYNGNTYSYNGPTTVKTGSTLTFANGNVNLTNSDVTIDAGATLELNYASGIDTKNSVKSLVLNGTLAVNISQVLTAGGNGYPILRCNLLTDNTTDYEINYTGANKDDLYVYVWHYATGFYSDYILYVLDKLKFTSTDNTVTNGSMITLSTNLTGITYSSSNTAVATVNATTGVVTGVAAGTATITATDAAYQTATKTITVTAASTPTIPSSNVCFPAKTPVMTNLGPVNIEDINPAVHTIRNKKIVAITKTVAHDKNLVRIAKHALGRNYPEKTTLISQNHKVFCQGQMIKAKYLVDNCNVTLVPYNGQVLYNVLLAEHEKMQVNNLIVETLHPEHKVAKLYRFLKNVDAAHHGKFIAAFNKKDLEQRLHR